MKIISAGLGLFTAVVRTANESKKPMLDGTEDFLQHELNPGFEIQASITELPLKSEAKIDFSEALEPLSISHTANK